MNDVWLHHIARDSGKLIFMLSFTIEHSCYTFYLQIKDKCDIAPFIKKTVLFQCLGLNLTCTHTETNLTHTQKIKSHIHPYIISTYLSTSVHYN